MGDFPPIISVEMSSNSWYDPQCYDEVFTLGSMMETGAMHTEELRSEANIVDRRQFLKYAGGLTLGVGLATSRSESLHAGADLGSPSARKKKEKTFAAARDGESQKAGLPPDPGAPLMETVH